MQHGLHAAVVERRVGYHHGTPFAVPPRITGRVPSNIAEKRTTCNHPVKPIDTILKHRAAWLISGSHIPRN